MQKQMGWNTFVRIAVLATSRRNRRKSQMDFPKAQHYHGHCNSVLLHYNDNIFFFIWLSDSEVAFLPYPAREIDNLFRYWD